MTIKDGNTKRIINFIRNHDIFSKQDIAQSLHLSMPTVLQNLTVLEDVGLIMQNGKMKSNASCGRSAIAYSLNPRSRIAFGMDITKNHVSCVAMGLTGEILGISHKHIVFSQSESYARALYDVLNELISKCELSDPTAILGLGIGVPALTSHDGLKVTYGRILDCTGMQCKELTRFIPYTARMYNDANAAGYAEMWFNKSVTNAFYICLGNNIGGSIILDNSVYSGNNMRSGEIGHTIVKHRGGELCFCGQRGCLETCCAATVLSNNTDGNLEEFFAQVEVGNGQFMKIFDAYLKNLSIAINNVRMLFDCDIIIGGYVGSYIDRYMNRLWNLVGKRNMFRQIPGDNPKDYLKPCMHKEEAIACGAALPFIDQYFEGFYQTN